MKEEEEGERRIKLKHSLLHAVAGKKRKTNKRQQRRRAHAPTHTYKQLYINI